MRAQTLSIPIFISHPLILKKKVNSKVFWATVFILMFFSLVSYIFQVNFLTREVYLIRDYEKKLTQLSQENENLEINFSKASSLSNIENYLQSQNFEKVSQIKYIQIYRPVAKKTSSR